MASVSGHLSLVFTGHMIDRLGRVPARFPPERIEPVRRELARHIERAIAGRPLAVVQGFASLAGGSDILFHEGCRAAGVATSVILPFHPDRFIRTSVEGLPGGDWVARFHALWDGTPLERRHDLGLLEGDEAYALCNRCMFDLAVQAGGPRLVALWDGGEGDGPGGTADLVARFRQMSGEPPDIIDPLRLAP